MAKKKIRHNSVIFCYREKLLTSYTHKTGKNVSGLLSELFFYS